MQPCVRAQGSGGNDQAVSRGYGHGRQPHALASAAKAGAVFQGEQRQVLAAHDAVPVASEKLVRAMVEGQRVMRAEVHVGPDAPFTQIDEEHAESVATFAENDLVPIFANFRNPANNISNIRRITF